MDILLDDDDASWVRTDHFCELAPDQVIVGLWGFQTCQRELTLFNFIVAKTHW